MLDTAQAGVLGGIEHRLGEGDAAVLVFKVHHGASGGGRLRCRPGEVVPAGRGCRSRSQAINISASQSGGVIPRAAWPGVNGRNTNSGASNPAGTGKVLGRTLSHKKPIALPIKSFTISVEPPPMVCQRISV
ncbi:MAG: hypothetical protein IPK53_19535 [bacterium]|nr:hypothetical protein [bacterium]